MILRSSASQSEWCPQNVLASKIDCTEYKKLSEVLLSSLPNSLQNNVVVRAPFAANCQISLGTKGGRGEPLKVAVELSPRRKITLSNMLKAESFLKKMGANAETYMLCSRSSNILSKSTKQDLGECPKRVKRVDVGLTFTGWEEFAN